MTIDEAIKELEEDKALYMPEEWIECLDRDTPDGRLMTALDMAIKALEQEPTDDATLKDIFCMGCEYKEQEPCDDAISRHKAIVMITAYEGKSAQIEALEQLPSVNPQEPKTGHWIKHDNGAWWECSECHAERAYGNEYCPDCGSHNGDIAKMFEPQESEKV